MNNRSILLGIALTIVIVFGITLESKAAQKEQPRQESKSTAVVEETWQKEWDNVKTKAREEGKIAIAGEAARGYRQLVTKAMKEKFGIDVEWLTMAGTAFAAKILTEFRTGIYSQDIVIGAPTTMVTQFKPAGIIVPLDEIIFLPEVLNPKAWYSGNLLWLDKEHHTLIHFLSPDSPILINTNLVKRGEIKSYRDLLDPKWKGKVIFGDDPSRGSGDAANTFYALAVAIMDLDYLRELAKQVPTIITDRRLAGEAIAKGKYPIGIGMNSKLQQDLIVAGAPVDTINPIEGVQLTASGGYVSRMKNAPHPNAAKVFINWILTREGGTIVSKGSGLQHARVDVPTDFLHPDAVRQPGWKYFNLLNEEQTRERRQVYPKVAAEVFKHLLK